MSRPDDMGDLTPETRRALSSVRLQGHAMPMAPRKPRIPLAKFRTHRWDSRCRNCVGGRLWVYPPEGKAPGRVACLLCSHTLDIEVV